MAVELAEVPSGQALVPTRADALKWTEEGALHIQRREDDQHLDYLRRAIACIDRVQKTWHDVPIACLNELREIQGLLLVRHRGPQGNFRKSGPARPAVRGPTQGRRK